MPRGPDPRENAAPIDEVPRLVKDGAAEYNARRFWHAHEAWESAWHALRAAKHDDAAHYLRGMILVTAALENATRGKRDGFKRQFAEGLHAMLTRREASAAIGVRDARAWEHALVLLYVDACRRRVWTHWADGDWSAPRLEVGTA